MGLLQLWNSTPGFRCRPRSHDESPRWKTWTLTDGGNAFNALPSMTVYRFCIQAGPSKQQKNADALYASSDRRFQGLLHLLPPGRRVPLMIFFLC